MSIDLTLPGESKDATPASAGLGEFADILEPKVVAATDVSAIRRGRAPVPLRTEAEPDDVLQLDWEDGIVELVRVGDLEDHFPQSVRSAEGRLEIPTRRTLGTGTRGTRDIGLDAIQQIRMKAADMIAGKAAGLFMPKAFELLENRHMPKPGLYHVDPSGELAAPVSSLTDASAPFLVLLHGTFSNTASGFGDLFDSKDWARLIAAYGDRILALEQHTVTESPAGNALQLVGKLPVGARLHLLSHSRGGLVGDLLCRYPWKPADLAELFADPSYGEVEKDLTKLARDLGRKKPVVERFVRVASPAAGTLLASKRIDTYLNVILSVAGKLSGPAAPAVQFIKAIATTIVSTRTRADVLPGLEAMMPHTDRGLVPFLNLAEPRGRDLAVIAGDVRGGGIFDRVKDFFSTLYYHEDNDFVVDSRSMFRGVPREEARGYYHRSPRADHFQYFAERETRERMVEWLAEGRGERFSPLNAAEAYGGLRGAGAATRGIPSLKKIEKERRKDRPVVFLLPGIMGTHLARDGDRHWIHMLRLAWGGMRKLEIGSPKIETDGLVEMVYEKLFKRLRNEYHVIPFGFDWRRPIAASAKLLGARIESELDSHERPVRIVAHSMGGLVSRALVLDRPELWERMTRRGGRLLMLGTPNHGSFVPAQVMTRKHKLMKRLAAADLRNSLDELTEIVRSFPGLVEMLPFKNGTDLLDPEAWEGFGDFFPNASALATAKAFRTRLAAGAIDPERMIYVAGHAEATPAAMERSGSDLTFRYTSRGDGTVPWDLGLLDGVDTYYVNAEHGQIPNYPPAFDAFMELLADGRTHKLDTAPPVVKRGVGDELFDLEPEEAEDELRYYPDETDIVAAIAGEPRDLERDFGPPLELEVTTADVREARYPVLVGHYEGDPIVSAEGVLDGSLHGILSRDLRLRRYPGRIGSARVYKSDGEPPGVVVAGLGEVGGLQGLGLEESLGAAMIEFALANLAAEGAPRAELRLSSLLIGTFGGTQLTVEDSIRALVNAVLATNQRLDEQGLAARAAIRGIEIVELYLDIATEAGHAAQRIAARSEGLVSAEPTVKQRKTARRSRPGSPYSFGWARRIRVRTGDGEIEYEVTTDLARSEPFQRAIQWSHVDSLLTSARHDDGEAASTLFQYLLPYQLIDQTANLSDVVLELDTHTARIPWELLDPPRDLGDATPPLGVRVGMLRTLSTPEHRANPRRPRDRRALVIGEPAGVRPPLPGAAEEAVEVARLLRSRNMEVEELVGADADEVFRALYRHEYDVVHIAAHGEFNEAGSQGGDTSKDESGATADAAKQAAPPSGVVLGEKRFLTPGEFRNLRAVPSIVFLNCCHLGKMEDGSVTELRLRQPGRLAASVAEELIKMGVGVVVAAGWAVNDAAAKTFADSLYSELLEGSVLVDAVREARRRAYSACGSGDLTWGAYQVYGDPGYVLHWAERRGRGHQPRDRQFVSPHELVEHISDFSPRGRGASKEQLEALKESLDRLAQGIPRQWKELGKIDAALGEAYANLGHRREAIESYARAIARSDAPLSAIEQLANIESRAAFAVAKDEPKQAATWFENSVARVRGLCVTSPSSERHSLIAAILKRRARATTGRSARERAARDRYLKEARDEYTRACELKPDNLYYPLSNKVALDLSLDPEKVKPETLDEIVQSAEACDDEWSKVAIADAGLIRFLAFGEGSTDEAVGAYAHAFTAGAGATRRERESMLQQLDWLVEFVEFVESKEIRERAEKVREGLVRQIDIASGEVSETREEAKEKEALKPGPAKKKPAKRRPAKKKAVKRKPAKKKASKK